MDFKQPITRALPPLDPDVIEELTQHARAIYDAARAEGATPAEAEARVSAQIRIWRREVPDLTRRPKRADAVRVPAASTSQFVGLIHDIRYAWRLLRRRPGPTVVSTITMALGIGAATVLFSVAWGVLFKPLPWPDADRLVRLSETRQGSTRRLPSIMTNGTYLAWREAPTTIEDIGGWRANTVTVEASGEPQRIRIISLTPSIFSMLRARPVLGSLFTGETPDNAVILSSGLWHQLFAGASEALGATVRIDGEARTIVGVMPPEFAFPDRDVRAWTPMRVRPVVGDNGSTLISLFSAMARLKPGVTPAQAAAEATSRGRSGPDPGLTAVAVFGSRGPIDVAAVPVLEAMTADVRQPLVLFLIAVGLLLATATANVASVQLARSTTRRREIAIRAALGAGAGRLARQLLIENVLIGLVGGFVGLMAAVLLHRALPALLPADFPRSADVTLDARVVVFSLLVSLVSAVAFGLVPALQARRVDLVPSLADDGLAPAGGSMRTATARLRALIMAGQVAVASVLLIGASLLVRSFVAMLTADRGYDITNILTARIPMPDASFTPARRTQVLDAILERVRATEGVTAAAFTTVLPLGTLDQLLAFTMPPSGTATDPIQVQAAMRIVSPSYVGAIGMRLAEGRGLADSDTGTSLPVVLVNRAFARRYFDNQALGRSLPAGLDHARGNQRWEVVGVLEDVRMKSVTDPPQPEIFVSNAQVTAGLSSDPSLVVRTTGDVEAFVPRLRELVRQQDGSLALDAVVTMEQRLAGNLARPRLYAVLLGAFAVCAVTIAAVGLFGVLSYSVSQRSREIAVRSALGARPSRIIRLVVTQGLLVTCPGLAAGLVTSFLLGRSISTFLYGVSPHDPLTFAAVPIVLGLIAALACFVPARRAARVDPVTVLRL